MLSGDFRFRFSAENECPFSFSFRFGRKWNFIFVGILVYGRKWKMLFGRPLVYITKRHSLGLEMQSLGLGLERILKSWSWS